MKTLWIIALTFFVLTNSYGETNNNDRYLILPFKSISSSNKKIAESIYENFRSKVSGSNLFIVLGRRELAGLRLKLIENSDSFAVDEKYALVLGEKYAANRLQYGKVTHVNTTYIKDNEWWKSSISFTMGIENIENGKFLPSISITENAISTDSAKQSQFLAVNKIVGSIWTRLQSMYSDLPKITKIKNQEVWININSRTGAVTGNKYKVFRQEKQYNSKGKYLGYDKREVGVIQIISVTTSIARAKILSGASTIKEQDIIIEHQNYNTWQPQLVLNYSTIQIERKPTGFSDVETDDGGYFVIGLGGRNIDKDYSVEFTVGRLALDNISITTLGIAPIYYYPLVYDFINLNIRGGIAYSFATQELSGATTTGATKAQASDIMFSLSTRLALVNFHGVHPYLELGWSRIGSFSEWQDDNDITIPESELDYKSIHTEGFTVGIGLNVSLDIFFN